MKKILQLVFNDFQNDSRVLRHAQAGCKAGFQVDVVALHRPPLAQSEQRGPIHIFRIALRSRFLPRNIFFQAFKYLELFWRLLRNFRNYDLIHCNDLDPLLMAVILKKLSAKKTRLLYDAHELETETSHLQNPWKKKLLGAMEKKLLKFTDQFITVGPMIAEEYKFRVGQTPEVILNCPNYYSSEKTDKLREVFSIPKEHKIFLYQGVLNRLRGIEKFLQALTQAPLPENVSVVLLGNGDALKSTAPLKIAPNIYHHPAVSHEHLPTFTSSADFGLVLMLNSCLNHDLSLPNKLFEYAMAGLPLIATPLRQISQFLQRFPIGITGNLFDRQEIAASFEKILAQPYEPMRAAALDLAQNYHWESEEKKIMKIYSDLLSETEGKT